MSGVAVFVPSRRVGGAEKMMLRIAGGLARSGVDTDLLVAEECGGVRTLDDGTRIVSLCRSRVATTLRPLVRYLRREQPAAVVGALFHTNAMLLLARWLARVPSRVIATQHIGPSTVQVSNWRERATRPLLRGFYDRADAVVAVSRGVADDLVQTMGVDADRVHVIYNPVVSDDTDRLCAEEPSHPWLEDGGAPVILGVGRLHPQKSFVDLVRAFALVRRYRDVRLLILGEGPDRSAVERAVRDEEVSEWTALPGIVGNPLAYMSRARVLALSSRWEGLPTVLIEALAAGCPVVSTDCPSGPREILENGRYGDLVPPGDVRALARAINRTLSRPVDAEALRRRGHEFGVARATLAYRQLIGV